MKSNKKIFLGIILILIVTIIKTTVVNATVKSEIEDTTEDYKKWTELSDEEKQNYLQPLPFSLEINTDNLENSNNQQNTKLKSATIPEKYKLSEDIELKVRNQESTAECWAFTTTNLISTNIEKKGISNYFTLFSTRHMNYATSLTFLDGQNELGYNRNVEDGGNCYIGLNYCTSGNGPVLESEMPFENNMSKINLSSISNKNILYQVEDYVQMPSIYKKIVDGKIVFYNGYYEENENYKEYTDEEVQLARNMIKTQILNYGAVSGITYVNGYKYFNTNNLYTADSYYCYNDELANHAITIVGWDDNYSASNFNTANPPEHDGAYIILNSHGSDLYDEGYMYVSYDDFLIEESLFSVVNTQEKDYDNIYQYDELGYCTSIYTGSNSMYMANVFEKKSDNTKIEYLNKVSIYVPEDANIEIYANVSGDNFDKISLIKSCGIITAGYHTIELSSPLKIESDNFIIAAKYTGISSYAKLPIEVSFSANGNGSNMWDTATGEEGQSYYSTDGTTWGDINKIYKQSNFCIKAFSTEEDIVNVEQVTLNKTNLSMKEGEIEQLTATITPETATNKNVTWESSDTSVATVNQDGQVTAVSVGKANITVTTKDGGYSAFCEVSVQEIIEKNGVGVTYTTHVQNIGWQSYVSNGATAGTTGKSLRLEAIKIKLNSQYSGGITYSTYVQNIGWQNYVSNGENAGTTGQSLRLEGIKIELTGDIANYYDIYYRAHAENFGWLDWAKNGEMAGTAGYSYRLEGIQIKLVEKGGTAPGSTTKPFREKSSVLYTTHVQNIGWQNYVSNGETAGTTGQSLRLEGIKINLSSQYSGGITYSTHVQNIGWQSLVSNNTMSGTEGRSLRLEAIKINLTGDIANYYDIYYRVHAENFGWLGWAKNGKEAGTSGYSYRLEAIQIVLVEKGGAAPGSTSNRFFSK